MNGKASPRYYYYYYLNYYLKQLLTGHGYFSKIGEMTRPNCIYGDASFDDAEHTFFHCKRWRLERRNLEAKIGACTIENFRYMILNSEENFNNMARYTEIMQKHTKFDLDDRSSFSNIVGQSGGEYEYEEVK